jgi:hypothetical protein
MLLQPLPGAPTMTINVVVLGSIGIEFYQMVGSNYSFNVVML